MTVPANFAAENYSGAIPVTLVTGAQGGPYTTSGSGAAAVQTQGPTAPGGAAVANPVLTGAVDGSGNVQDVQCNGQISLLPSAARTANTSSSAQSSKTLAGLIAYLNVTIASGTGGLTLRIQGLDPISGVWASLNASPTAITAIGLYAYEIYPGDSVAGSMQQRTPGVLPDNWRILVTVGDGSSYTYSVGIGTIQA